MTPQITAWQPIEPAAIQAQLGAFRDWCLCGGQSIDWLLGRITRAHGDTDIGVFRSDLMRCLEQIGTGRVFLCHPPGSLMSWDGAPVPESVHDIWVTDPAGLHWVFQIMVYDDAGDAVIYRRDPRIRWPKSAHWTRVRGINVVNLTVTLLFKLNKAKLEDKDCDDVRALIRTAFRS